MFRSVVLLSCMGAASFVHSESLSFDASLELAVKASPDIAAQTASIGAAQSGTVSAGTLPDPKLVVGIENLPVTGQEQWSLTRDFMTMRKVGLLQEVPNRGKRRAQEEVATATVARAEAERRVRVLTVRLDAALAWLNRYYFERRNTLFDALERENRLFADTVQAQLAGGRGMPVDVLGPKQEAAELADRRDELAGQWAQSKAALKRWVGPAADGPLAGDPPKLDVDSEHLRGHVHEHPQLAVFVPMMQAAQAEVHEAEAMKRPDWGVELDYGRRGAAFSDMVSLQFTIPLPLFNRTRHDAQIVAKREEVTRIEDEREGMLRDHTEELDRDLAQYDTITRQLARMREVRLPLARQKVDYQFASYRAGKADLTAVLAARRELIDQELKEIELDSQHAAVAAKLYFTYGEGAQ